MRVFAGGAVGHAYTSDLSDGALDAVVQRAVAQVGGVGVTDGAAQRRDVERSAKTSTSGAPLARARSSTVSRMSNILSLIHI